MIRKILFLCPLAFIMACSTMMNGPTQEMRIETPGVDGALCFLESPGYRRRVWAPNIIKIRKSAQPLEITCLAPGNRSKVVILEPVIHGDTYLNAATAGVGALVDYETGAMFAFPELVVVDFSQMPPRPMPLPAYQELFRQYPDLTGIEEFRPGKAALQRDRYSPVPTLLPRGGGDEPAGQKVIIQEAIPAAHPKEGSLDGTAIIDDANTVPVTLQPRVNN